MGSNADTATIGSNTSPEDYRGASTDDPDELREIASAVRSDLWWAEDEFTVVIQKEEESPALGGVFVLLAMLVGMAATMMRRKG